MAKTTQIYIPDFPTLRTIQGIYTCYIPPMNVKQRYNALCDELEAMVNFDLVGNYKRLTLSQLVKEASVDLERAKWKVEEIKVFIKNNNITNDSRFIKLCDSYI